MPDIGYCLDLTWTDNEMIIMGERMVFGVPNPVKPFGYIPEGCRLRLRMRNNAFVLAYTKNSYSITEWLVREEDGYWYLCHPQKRNTRL